MFNLSLLLTVLTLLITAVGIVLPMIILVGSAFG